ncbi:MAG: GNAT family N-acetyltransferase [Bacteroidia bacterium]|jgi:ElaA protein
MAITWKIKAFDELSAHELYEIFHLRLAVFAVEQNAVYQDADGKKDLKSHHITGRDEQGELVAYARIIPAGIAYEEASIGRVATSSKARGTGVGRELFKNALQFLLQTYGNVPVRISAQSYLIKFYSGFGFKAYGEEYLEDCLPHTGMLREAQ